MGLLSDGAGSELSRTVVLASSLVLGEAPEHTACTVESSPFTGTDCWILSTKGRGSGGRWKTTNTNHGCSADGTKSLGLLKIVRGMALTPMLTSPMAWRHSQRPLSFFTFRKGRRNGKKGWNCARSPVAVSLRDKAGECPS